MGTLRATGGQQCNYQSGTTVLNFMCHHTPNRVPALQHKRQQGFDFSGLALRARVTNNYKMNKTTHQTVDIINLQKIATRDCDLWLTARATNNQKLNKSTNFKLEV
jgi:hypothetical protein